MNRALPSFYGGSIEITFKYIKCILKIYLNLFFRSLMLACSPDMSGGNPSGGREDPTHTPTSLLNNLAWIPPTNTVEEPPTSSVLGSNPIRGSAPPIRGLAQPHPPGPSDFPGFIRPAHHRPPFFIREIYKNGFLKRLPYNEKKSSALAKLMKSDRFWVVFSIHDDIHPFLELWHEPTEVASKPPVYIFPLVACQHISPSIIPADQEWSFVINFDTVAIRFSCNSREVMDDWVEVIRNKLGEMGILNPKGNLYSKVPLGPPVTKPVIRDPTSPLPQPPERPLTVSLPESESGSSIPKLETIMPPQTKSVIETSNGENTSFTTSIYLNQTPESSTQTTKTPSTSLIVNRKSSLPQNPITKTKVTGKSISLSQSLADVKISAQGTEKGSGTGTSSVYLNQSSPNRHVTVIPINSQDDEDKEGAVKQEESEGVNVEFVEYENHTYGAIFDFEDKIAGTDKIVLDTSKPVVSHETSPKQQDRNYDSNPKILDNTMQKENTSRNASSPRRKASSPYKRESSPRKKESSPKRKDSSPRRKDSSPRRRDSSPRRSREKQREGYYSSRERLRDEPPPLPHRPVLRRLSERRQEVYEDKVNIKKKIRKKSQRSSSLGPLLDSNQLGGTEIGASTHSLESVESNPRQAVPKSDRGLGAIPRRPLPLAPRYEDQGGHPLLTSPTRALAELPPGVRPPSYHPLLGLGSATPGSGKGFPPMVPLPGLTCQLSALPGAAGSIPQPAPEERTWNQEDRRSLREQQVLRLRQELAHPGGVRLILR